MAQLSLAIVGATGNVGREIIRLLEQEEHKFLKGTPAFLASSVSAGDEVSYGEDEFSVKSVAEFDFSTVDAVVFATSKAVSMQYAPIAKGAGARVVDLSGAFRTEESVPVFTRGMTNSGIMPQTEIVSVADTLSTQLYPILKELQGQGVQSVVSTALIPAGRQGASGMEELFGQTAGLLGGAGGNDELHGHAFTTQIAFNVIPHVGDFVGSTTDVEMAPVLELNRMLESALPISTTAVFVPTFVGTSQSVTLTFAQPANADEIRKAFENNDLVTVIDNPEKAEYSTPYGAAETSKVYLSRVRVDALNPNVAHLWLTCDNLRQVGVNSIEALKALA